MPKLSTLSYYQLNGQKLILLILLVVMPIGQGGWYSAPVSSDNSLNTTVSEKKTLPCQSKEILSTSTVKQQQCDPDSLLCCSCTGMVSPYTQIIVLEGEEVKPLDPSLNYQYMFILQLLRPPYLLHRLIPNYCVDFLRMFAHMLTK